ncbi:MAG: hypothetical protein WC789_09535 [Lentisphaeria bacterium]
MMLIVLPIELKPGPDADRIFAEVKDAIRAAADTYSRKDPLGADLEALADSARLLDMEAERFGAEQRCDFDQERTAGFLAALERIAGGGK